MVRTGGGPERALAGEGTCAAGAGAWGQESRGNGRHQAAEEHLATKDGRVAGVARELM